MKMMKRAIFATAALALSSTAFATGINFDSGDLITSASAECPLLGEGVTLNLSKNVSGAYMCDTTYTDIRIATCHAAGSNKSTTIDCAVVGFATDGTTPLFNSATSTCSAPWSITNYRVFGGSSKGGAVAAMANTGSCLTAPPEGHAFMTVQ